MPKYKSYTELAAAFKSGELSSHYYIMLDKGGMDASLNYYNKDESDEVNEAKQEACRDLFKPEYCDHIFDLYAALGIRAEWC